MQLAVVADHVFDGTSLRRDCAVIVDGSRIRAVIDRSEVPAATPTRNVPPGSWQAQGAGFARPFDGDLCANRAALREGLNGSPAGLARRRQADAGDGRDAACRGQLYELPAVRSGRHRRRRRCTTADGSLAGSVLDMVSAVRNCVRLLDMPLAQALSLASANPGGVSRHRQ